MWPTSSPLDSTLDIPSMLGIVPHMSTTATETRRRENARKGGAIAREGGVARGGGASTRERVLAQVEAHPVSEGVLVRGLHTYDHGVVKQNKTYPWIFMVSSTGGNQAYRVDLAAWNCGCQGFGSAGGCRHLVAAAREYMEGEK